MASFGERLRFLFRGGEEVKAAPPVIQYHGVGSEVSYKTGYADLANEGYKKNAIVYRCVNEIANGVAQTPLVVYSDDQRLDGHPLSALLRSPAPTVGYSEFFQSLVSQLLLSGNAFVVRSGPEMGEPQELYLLRPDRMRIKPGKYLPMSYEYVLNGRVVESYAVDPDTGYSEVKHIKLWNPLDDYMGCSPLLAAAVDVDQHNLSAKHNVNLLNNGARPSGAVIFKPQDDGGMSVTLTESQRQQLLSDLKNRFSGTENTGRPLLLEGDFDWKEMGLSPRDMDFLQMKNMAARDIALCFGVPGQLVGVPDSQTYSNMQEARLALYEETIIPMLRHIETDMNEWLSPQFGESIRVAYDIDEIPAMAERRRLIYENVISAVREGIITRNEARGRLGMEEMEGADDIFIPANLFPLGASVPEPSDDETRGEDSPAAEIYSIQSGYRLSENEAGMEELVETSKLIKSVKETEDSIIVEFKKEGEVTSDDENSDVID